MNKLLGLVLALAMTTTAFANTSFYNKEDLIKSDRIYGNIEKGSWAIGASSNQNFSTVWEEGKTRSAFGLSTSIQYFARNQLGLGGIFSIGSIGSNTTLKVGPALTYYYWTMEKAGLYVTPAVLFSTKASDASVSSPSSHFESSLVLGMNYFIVPSVAFGPGLEYAHVFRRSGIKKADSLGLNINFSLFL